MRLYELINTSSQKTVIPSTPVPTQLKHQRVIRNLAKQFARAANVPTATRADIRAAADRFMTDQKRADLEYKKQQRYALWPLHSKVAA